MDDKIEAIRAAVAGGATPEQKAHGAQACRTILAALGAEPGKPIALPGVPAPHPLAGIDPGHALDLLIAKLTAALPRDGGKPEGAAGPPAPPPMRIALVPVPPRRTSSATPTRVRPRRGP